jgi:Toprim domain
MNEARAFLSLPYLNVPSPSNGRSSPMPRNSSNAARRLFAISRPIAGTAADLYLRRREILPDIVDSRFLRFHPRCYYRDGDDAPTRTFPALIAAVTDATGRICGVHRTWLVPSEASEKAPVASPRRAMGNLLGCGVRFGMAPDALTPIIAAGEGLETMMSQRMVMPTLPMIAALSANHLAALLLPASLGRLYVAVDADPAGRNGMMRLSRRARQLGIEVLTLTPRLNDFNEDLRRRGCDSVVADLRDQLLPQDAMRFLLAA